MLKLIANEHMKIARKRSSQVLVITFIFIHILLALIINSLLQSAGIAENVVGYLSFSSGFLIMIQFFSAIFAGSIVAKEFDWGTVKLLLIRPHTRYKLLLSKYITSLLIGGYFILLFFVLSFILGSILFGFQGLGQSSPYINSVLSSYGVVMIEVIMITTFAFALSTIFRNSTLATAASIFIILTGKTVVELLAHYDIKWGMFLLFANTDLGQYFDGKRPLYEEMTLPFSIIVIVVHLLIFLLASFWTFSKRDVSI
ncbi:ABC transporter permease [Metabacillus arenae]|uniref:ABC transporter permease n=1 Tax=Metabacillus arenae TaxID=2771434 RepID=A0A926RWG7_9BACI|nr:ABC transporter permease [Metabacillus arenae]MBD1379565.1 ABC transporter permease [Metabacillus arenae]